MTATNFTIQHAGLALQAYHWPVQGEPTGKALGIVHGLGEHAGRYEAAAAYFTTFGYDVFAFDHQGHGLSDGQRGTIVSWANVLAEINSFRGAVEGALDNLSEFYLWGHSYGGLVVLDYICNQPSASSLAGAIVTSPPLALSVPPPDFLVKLAPFAAKLTPKLTKSNGLNVNALSRDAGVISKYISDPLVHDRVSMLLGAEMLARPAALLSKTQAPACKLLLMHGDQDGITAVIGSRQFASTAVGEVDYKEWAGLYHELHNEPEQRDVYDYMLGWLTT